MKLLKTSLAILSMVLVLLSIIAIVVDGVAILFTYLSLLVALFSISTQTKNILKIYGVFFLIAHLVLGTRIVVDMTQQTNGSSQNAFHPQRFVKCSNEMFSAMEPDSKQLTVEQQKQYDECLTAKISN